MPEIGHRPSDPEHLAERGYGLGRPDGLCLLEYRASGVLAFPEARQDFLHQLYWCPDGLLWTRHGAEAGLLGPDRAFWARRGTTHDVRAGAGRTLYRLCLREVPDVLLGIPAGAVHLPPEAADLVRAIARPGVDTATGLAARASILAALGPVDAVPGRAPRGNGLALAVERALADDPGDPAGLAEWAARLHTSTKTLQRDVAREFGTSWTRWRTRQRMRVAHALLEVEGIAVGAAARRVGYVSTSAFIAAYAAEFGRTPGGRRRVRPAAPR